MAAAAVAALAARWVVRSRPAWAARVAQLEHAWGWDLAALGAGLALHIPALTAEWSRLSPYRSPYGPDSDMNYFAAIALFRADMAMYGQDRYPAFAWLSAVFAPDALHVVAVARDAHDQRTEDDRHDDRLDHPQEDRGERA